ncbi:MAG: ACT domain-containing protein [Mesorhizobium sp.]|nr:ACT domain-containing protein [Mesorhizobium sp.]MBN9242619.1 ACT domain-containing protein [Mesorhizobium sp.]MBN9273504.1 ACT domain-containing protein [Mesorhizobium sp.]
MTGETDLKTLLRSMQPKLHPAVLVFATLPHGARLPDGLDAVMTFKEREGLTCILAEEAARNAGMAGTFRCRMVTLEVHSSLEAVGFLAAITARLAEAGMGVNPVSGFYHDHLFVPAERAEEAMAVLRELSSPG